MKQRTHQQIKYILLAFAGMLAMLFLLLWQGLRRGDAVRVGVPRSAAAYGAGMLLQTPSAQYRCVLGSTALALQDALLAGELDAALLPYELAAAATGCEIRAVLGYEPLAALSRGGPTALDALSGQTLALHSALQGGRGERALRKLLRECGIPCDIVYAEGPEGTQVFFCDVDTASTLLREDAALSLCFSLGREWRLRLPSLPPAGLCLVVRQDYLASAGSDYAAFEKALSHAMAYGGEKRKKTVAMAAAAGLADSEETADALYPCCDFRYLTGTDMQLSLRAVP